MPQNVYIRKSKKLNKWYHYFYILDFKTLLNKKEGYKSLNKTKQKIYISMLAS